LFDVGTGNVSFWRIETTKFTNGYGGGRFENLVGVRSNPKRLKPSPHAKIAHNGAANSGLNSSAFPFAPQVLTPDLCVRVRAGRAPVDSIRQYYSCLLYVCIYIRATKPTDIYTYLRLLRRGEASSKLSARLVP